MNPGDDPDNAQARAAFGEDPSSSPADAFGRPQPPERAEGDTPSARRRDPDDSTVAPAPGAAIPPQAGFAPPVAPTPPDPIAPPGFAPPQPPDRPPVATTAPAKRTSGKATASLVVGVLGWLICPIVLSVAAIVLARQAQREIAANPGLGGQSTAQAGLIVGVLGLVVMVGIVVVSVAIALLDGGS